MLFMKTTRLTIQSHSGLWANEIKKRHH